MADYWFRKRKGLFSRDLGWGWTPISREGWLFVIIVIFYAVLSSLYIVSKGLPDMQTGIYFIGNIAFIIIVSVIVSIKKCRPEESK